MSTAPSDPVPSSSTGAVQPDSDGTGIHAGREHLSSPHLPGGDANGQSKDQNAIIKTITEMDDALRKIKALAPKLGGGLPLYLAADSTHDRLVETGHFFDTMLKYNGVSRVMAQDFHYNLTELHASLGDLQKCLEDYGEYFEVAEVAKLFRFQEVLENYMTETGKGAKCIPPLVTEQDNEASNMLSIITIATFQSSVTIAGIQTTSSGGTTTSGLIAVVNAFCLPATGGFAPQRLAVIFLATVLYYVLAMHSKTKPYDRPYEDVPLALVMVYDLSGRDDPTIVVKEKFIAEGLLWSPLTNKLLVIGKQAVSTAPVTKPNTALVWSLESDDIGKPRTPQLQLEDASWISWLSDDELLARRADSSALGVYKLSSREWEPFPYETLRLNIDVVAINTAFNGKRYIMVSGSSQDKDGDEENIGSPVVVVFDTASTAGGGIDVDVSHPVKSMTFTRDGNFVLLDFVDEDNNSELWSFQGFDDSKAPAAPLLKVRQYKAEGRQQCSGRSFFGGGDEFVLRMGTVAPLLKISPSLLGLSEFHLFGVDGSQNAIQIALASTREDTGHVVEIMELQWTASDTRMPASLNDLLSCPWESDVMGGAPILYELFILRA
ncbi:hypothetical protein K488DRAFT_72297 [Vararia minispora EC-137]|uniref:Uncharacterized protein n=1 Tax=Vararia minispora EC-137 TaxID=1314806 RepID=A0ACB8QFA3_9AGAM|nr:hypothetical protein K488DRAFT_72297 [Vararia minispora EC-137]